MLSARSRSGRTLRRQDLRTRRIPRPKRRLCCPPAAAAAGRGEPRRPKDAGPFGGEGPLLRLQRQPVLRVMMFNSLRRRWLVAGAVGVTATLLTAAPATPSEYSCHVPRALLCEGCASHIAI